MGGNNITLGQDITKPISHRSFEVLGSTWAIYRYRQTEELMINATIERTFTVGENELPHTQTFAAEFFPNPADNIIYADLTTKPEERILISLYSPDGKKVFENKIPSGHAAHLVIPLDAAKLENGIYLCRIRAGDVETVRKITVTH